MVLANIGVALAGLRNYLGSLNAEVLRQMVTEPDDVADVFWDLRVKRDRVEATIAVEA